MNQHVLAYSKHGTKDQIICLFHGFGQDRNIFNSWLPQLTKKYTVYTFDLYYHGESARPYGKLSKKEWQKTFDDFLQKESITTFSLLGFSLGGRFAVATSILFKDQIRLLILIAPDSIYLTPWFHMATSFPFRWFFKFYMLNPNKLDGILGKSRRLGLISSYMYDFVKRELGTPENRKRVYISWNHFKSIGYTHRQLREHYKKATFKKTLLLGEKDIVIPPNKILPILKGCDFQIIRLNLKHHQLIKEEVIHQIMK